MQPESPGAIVLPETTLWYNLEVSAQRYPGKTAIECFGQTISYRDLHGQAEAIAGWLQQVAGVRRGDRVLLYMQNCPQFLVAYYAILRADAVVVPVNPMNRADEFRHYVSDSGARVVVCADDAFDSGIGADLLSESGLQQLLVTRYADALPTGDSEAAATCTPPAWMTARHDLPAWAASRVSHWTEALTAGHVPAPHAAKANDMAVMPYTSGTTGFPKGCIHTHRSVMQNAVGNAVWSSCGAESVVLSVLPLFHVSGMQHGMHTPIYCGATVVMLPRWDREAAGRLIAAHRVTHWMGNPTMVIDLLASANLEAFDLSSLRHVGGGGAAMPQAVADRLARQFGLQYLEGYGLSETMAATHNNPRQRPKQQCLGLPAFNTVARIVDPETFAVLPPGEAGEIVVHGPQVFQGYWGRPDATREAFIELDGKAFFRTGDIGVVDEDGYYFMTDRLKRMINVSGYKVWPSEVENLLYGHPGVLEACVIGSRDPYRGETVKALVVLGPDAGETTAESLIDWARQHMAAYKYPRVVEFVDALPKSGTGKVLWRQLQEAENASR
jgi:fatty-acyl-CoA synthase